jgi:hypothetical protein
LVDEFEHKFTGSISGDAGDVNFELAHVIAQVRIFAKPLAQFSQHLQICIDGEIIGEASPACMRMALEYTTDGWVLR